VRRQIVVIVAETTDLHEVPYHGSFRSHSGVTGRDAFLLHEVVTDPERVHEIHDLINVVECGSDG